jgi:hypothetical protein
MTMERYIRAIAGSFVLLSLLLGYLYSPWWHLFTAFVGDQRAAVRVHQVVLDGRHFA